MAAKWQQPLYSFDLPSRKILVNVTKSCPTFSVPAPAIPDIGAELKKQGMTKVLDFGAGKLRNSLFLLSKRVGFKVWAVEFNDCFETPVGQQRLAQANRYKDFFYLEFPHKFFQSKVTADAVLLVNVANVVPDEGDRRIIIEECTKRLRPGGWFLWMSHYDEPNYKPGATKRLKAPDGGWFYSLDREQQVYNKNFSIPEIKDYFSNRQYRELRKVSAAHHHAFLFEKL